MVGINSPLHAHYTEYYAHASESTYVRSTKIDTPTLKILFALIYFGDAGFWFSSITTYTVDLALSDGYLYPVEHYSISMAGSLANMR